MSGKKYSVADKVITMNKFLHRHINFSILTHISDTYNNAMLYVIFGSVLASINACFETMITAKILLDFNESRNEQCYVSYHQLKM